MASDDNKVSFSLDLDTKEFIDGVLNAKGVIQGLGNSENLSGLIEGLTAASTYLAAAGLAAFALKEALDFTIEAEKIEQVNKQFEFLTENVGLVTEEFKKQLIASSHGLVSEIDLLKTANQALVTMGSSASRLPEIMELANKMTLVFGGTVQENFQTLTKAVEMGNARMLKHLGITVDVEKAYQDYANKIGVAVSTLSAQGKQVALLNQVLDEGTKKYEDINLSTSSAISLWQQLKVTVSELGELFTVVIGNKIGPLVRGSLQEIKTLSTGVKDLFLEHFGTDAQKAEANLESLQGQLSRMKSVFSFFESKKGSFITNIFGGDDALAKFKQHIADVENQISKLEQKNKTASNVMTADAQAKLDKDSQNQQKALQAYAKYTEQETALDQSHLKALEAVNIDMNQSEAMLYEERRLRIQKLDADIRAIESSQLLDRTQKDKLIVKSKEISELEIQAIQFKSIQTQQKLGDNLLKHQEVNLKSFVVGAQQAALKVGTANQTMASISNNAVTAATDSMSNELISLAETGEFSAQRVLQSMLKSIGQQAVAEGTKAVFSGAIELNPMMIATGGAEIAFGMGILALAGGGAGGVSASTPSSVASNPNTDQSSLSNSLSSSNTNLPVQQDQTSQMSSQEVRQKTVTIAIAGNYFDTDSSRRQLMDIIRAETDATDFRYARIGQS